MDIAGRVPTPANIRDEYYDMQFAYMFDGGLLPSRGINRLDRIESNTLIQSYSFAVHNQALKGGHVSPHPICITAIDPTVKYNQLATVSSLPSTGTSVSARVLIHRITKPANNTC